MVTVQAETGLREGWHRLEEIARHKFTARMESSRRNLAARPVDDRRQVDEDPARARARFQDGGHERSVAAPDIDDGPDRREVIRTDHSRGVPGSSC